MPFTDGFSGRLLSCRALRVLLEATRQPMSVTYVVKTLAHWSGFFIILKGASASLLRKGKRRRESWIRSGNGSGSPRAGSRTPSLLIVRDFASTRAFCHVRRKSKRVHTPPPPRVLRTIGFLESPFLRRTLRFTRKLLPVSQQTRIIRNEREWLTAIFPPVPRSGNFRFEARRCGQVVHDG